MERIVKLASENGILILSKSSCCMCYTVQILLQELGVRPRIHEIDGDRDGKEIEKALIRMGCTGPVPAIFISGTLVGSTKEVMSLHLSGSLIPLIRPYQIQRVMS